MDTSLTIVLPVHNAEAHLRRNVSRVLEVAAELTPRFELLVVDDGSTDDTFEIASELAAEYPQLAVVRSGLRKGLGGTLRDVKRRASGRVVIVHDGVSTINANELRTLYLGADDEVSVEDLRRPAIAHKAMVAAHSRLRGFQVIDPSEVESSQPAAPQPARARRAANAPQPGVGQIPPLPKPNFLGAMGDFARGE